MFWNAMSTVPVQCSREVFMKAVDVWIYRPNVCSKIISCASVEQWKDWFSKPHCQETQLEKEILCVVKSYQEKGCSRQIDKSEMDHLKVFNRLLVPKKTNLYLPSREIIIVFTSSVLFIPVAGNENDAVVDINNIPYAIEFVINSDRGFSELESVDHVTELLLVICDHELHQQTPHCNDQRVTLEKSESDQSTVWYNGCINNKHRAMQNCFPTELWLKEKLIKLVAKWSMEEKCKKSSKQSDMLLPSSLSLIPKQKYAIKYQMLKDKYGKELMKVWTEVTDPQKYVYEDIAIATYLILLWEDERERMESSRFQSFIDLGCGNGLLVHLLNSEGYPGVGVDVRCRKIWDSYPSTTKLIEQAVDPTNGISYCEYDWLLGNHSDELTPWLPVLASRAGYRTRYWVLPCCFYDFFCKYKRSQSVQSQYKDYLDYVESIGIQCGFDVEVDVMRIPSTKRVCHIGMKKSYPEEKHLEILSQMDEFITNRSAAHPIHEKVDLSKLRINDAEMPLHFEARERVEKVRNCTKVDRGAQAEIVKKITTKLLEKKNLITIHAAGDVKKWNKGGNLNIKDCMSLLDDSDRACMKSECGGLQTLLRNHHQIFVIKSGYVEIRNWYEASASGLKKQNHQRYQKTRLCWFNENHPNGCPRVAEHCSFKHGPEDTS